MPRRPVPRLLPAALLAGALALGGCSFTVPDADSRMTPAAGESAAAPAERSGGFPGLPCFGCHKSERFLDAEVFPHETHRMMGLHCNQCHRIRAHHETTLNGRTCTGCHNLGVIELSSSSMPVRFDHAAHMGMFDCKTCHRSTFRMKAGADRMTMEAINEGKGCGSCHDGGTAFAPDNCGACHVSL